MMHIKIRCPRNGRDQRSFWLIDPVSAPSAPDISTYTTRTVKDLMILRGNTALLTYPVAMLVYAFNDVTTFAPYLLTLAGWGAPIALVLRRTYREYHETHDALRDRSKFVSVKDESVDCLAYEFDHAPCFSFITEASSPAASEYFRDATEIDALLREPSVYRDYTEYRKLKGALRARAITTAALMKALDKEHEERLAIEEAIIAASDVLGPLLKAEQKAHFKDRSTLAIESFPTQPRTNL